MKNFNIFIKECDKWIDRMELNNWGVEYKAISKTPSEHPAYATIQKSSIDKKSTIRFYIEENKGRSIEDIKETAKHEIIHLLLGDVVELAEERYIRENELIACEEGLVQKLIRLIK